MKVAARLTGAFGLLVVLLVGLVVYHVRMIHRTVSTSYELSEISARLALASDRLPAHLARLDETASKYWITRDPGYRAQFDEALAAFDDGLRRLAESPLGTREAAALEELARLREEFSPLADALEPPQAAPGARYDEAPLEAVSEHIVRLRAQARLLAQASQERMAHRLDQSAVTARRVERVTWGAVVVALLPGILFSGMVVRSISDALRRLQEGTRQVAGGNFEYRLAEDRDDEFAELARDFNVMTQRLGELDRMKRDFLSKVSHDLKTPLASMQETTRLLLDEVPGPLTETQARLLRLNHEGGQRLSAMISKILDLSAMESGTLGVEIGHHDAAALVQQAVAVTSSVAADRSVRITTEIADPAPRLACDGDLVIQVLVNLLENAVKFSPEGGTVRLAARTVAERPAEVPEEHWNDVVAGEDPAPAVLVSVVDEGPGVPEDEADAIFDRFYQTSAGRRVQGRGVGLGLCICREIVDAHGGAIWVRPNPRGGSVFSVLLPRALPLRRAPVEATSFS